MLRRLTLIVLAALVLAGAMALLGCGGEEELSLPYPLKSATLESSSREAIVYLASGVKAERVVDVSSLGKLWPKATLEEARAELGTPSSVRREPDGLHSVYPHGGNELVIVQREELREDGRGSIPRWELRSYPPGDSFAAALPPALQRFLDQVGPRVRRVAVVDDDYRGVVLELEAGKFRYLSQPLDPAASGPPPSQRK